MLADLLAAMRARIDEIAAGRRRADIAIDATALHDEQADRATWPRCARNAPEAAALDDVAAVIETERDPGWSLAAGAAASSAHGRRCPTPMRSTSGGRFYRHDGAPSSGRTGKRATRARHHPAPAMWAVFVAYGGADVDDCEGSP